MPSPRLPRRLIVKRSVMASDSSWLAAASSGSRDRGQITARGETVEAPDQERGKGRKAEREADPDADRAEARPERQCIAAREADQPEADRGVDHRHLGVVEAAQCAGGNALEGVGDKPGRADQQKQ